MKRTLLALTLIASSLSFGQQGGRQGEYQGDSVQAIERGISTVLSVPESKSVLTPGEFNEWPQKLKAGQVIIADARSDAFDPGLEIVDDKGKSLASNDDRYPGDQRPLVIWRCDRDGDYAVRVRCFRDKSGGQFFLRFRVFDSIDLVNPQPVERDVDGRAPFLLHVPMQAGQIKDVVSGGDVSTTFNLVLTPVGLPERTPSLAEALSPAILALVAPVGGDYYLMMTPNGRARSRAKVRFAVREFVPTALTGGVGKSATKSPVIWKLPVKAGENLEATLSGLSVDCRFRVSEAIDFKKFDVSKPETNPFFPQPPRPSSDERPLITLLRGREGDSRIAAFHVNRDGDLWLATDGAAPNAGEFSIRVYPAAPTFDEERTNRGKLRIAKTDYWAFDANAGDVMTIESVSTGFSQQIGVLDPDLAMIHAVEPGLDETSARWQMTIQKPGRYLVSMSCLGNGGGGDYALTRKSFHPKEFTLASPATGSIAKGDVQVWKFTATPDSPLLVKWTSSNWNYEVSIYDDKGRPTSFQRDAVDDHQRFGILKVGKPQTFVIVLVGSGERSRYSIEFAPLPGFAPKKP